MVFPLHIVGEASRGQSDFLKDILQIYPDLVPLPRGHLSCGRGLRIVGWASASPFLYSGLGSGSVLLLSSLSSRFTLLGCSFFSILLAEIKIR